MEYWPLPTKKDRFVENVTSILSRPLPENVGLVHSWCLRSVESAWTMAFRLKVPWTIGFHDSPDQEHHGKLRTHLIYKAAEKCNGIVTVSEAMKDKCRTLGIQKVPEVILNGLYDIETSDGTKSCRDFLPKSAVVGFLGMNAPHKGFKTVINWVSETQCKWNLYGDIHPDLKSDLVTLLNMFPERVLFQGRKESLSIYNEVDIVVMPTETFEPFGLVALEAARAGIPVIASKAGGLPEIIKHGQTGYLYEINNPVSGIKYINKLTEDTFLNHKLGKNARQNYLQNFSGDSMSSKWNAFFQWQLNEHK
jgi:glycosyltransferase involved in cell wall biosynthesis